MLKAISRELNVLPSLDDLVVVLTRASVKLLVLCALLFCATRTFFEPDIYRHLKVGIDMCTSGALATKDTYSFLSLDQPWINHEWLSDLIFGYIYWHFGWVTLVFFKVIVVALLLAIVYEAIANLKMDMIGEALLLFATAFFTSLATNTIRPHIFSCVFLALTFSLLGKARKGKPELLWVLLPMFSLWVNLHGGFVIGLMTMLFWTTLESIASFQRQTRKGSIAFYWLILAGCSVATLVNPYGYKLPLFVLSAATLPRPYISEWEPIQLATGMGALWLGMVVLVVTGLLMSKSPRDLGNIALWLLYAIAPLASIRHLEFFGLATAYFMGDHLASAWNQRKRVASTKLTRQQIQLDSCFAIIALFLSIWLANASVTNIFTPTPTPGLIEPTGAVNLLETLHIKGNLLLDNVHWGSYISWRLAPQVKVSWDGRDECVYSLPVRLANLLFEIGAPHWDYLLDKFPVDMVLVRPCYPAYSLMRMKPGWELVYEDETCALFLPSGHVNKALLNSLHP